MAMAIYHLSAKTFSRANGRSVTAAAAYRAATKIQDERTGLIHDYSRKQGVQSTHIVLPVAAPSWAKDRSQLWNAAEQAETRKNATVAREFERSAQLQNHCLQQAGAEERVDHRSLIEQGITRVASRHLGSAAVGFERRTGLPSRRRLEWEQEVSERLLAAKQAGELERQAQVTDSHIVALSSDIKAAQAEWATAQQQKLQKQQTA